MAWCEANRVEYLLGLAKNERLKAEIAKEMEEAKAQYQETGHAARLFKEFVYQTRESWSRARRVVAKAEHLEKGENPRFVVTSLSAEAWPAQALYEEHYCAKRGHGESHKGTVDAIQRPHQHALPAQQSTALVLFFDRLRVVADAAAAGTGRERSWPRPSAPRIRLKLLKIGALIRITVRKVWVSLAGGYPHVALFRQVHEKLCAVPVKY